MKLIDLIDLNDEPLYAGVFGSSQTTTTTDSIKMSSMINAQFRRFDVVDAKKLRYVAAFAPSIEECSAHATILRKLNAKMTVGDDGVLGRIPVDYELKSGRLFTSDGAGLQGLKKCVRNWLVPPGTLDIDIKNAAPSILNQLGKKHGIATPSFDSVVDVLEVKCEEVCPDDPKGLKGVLLFGPQDISPSMEKPDWMRGLISEMRDVYYDRMRVIYPEIQTRAQRKVEMNERGKRVRVETLSDKVRGMFFSMLYFEWETKVMRVVEKEGRDRGFWKDELSMMFDGLMTRARDGDETDLGVLERKVMSELGIEIKLDFKRVASDFDVELDNIPARVVVIDGDEEASDIVALKLGREGVACRSCDVVYVKMNGVWSSVKSQVDSFLLGYVASSGIMLESGADDKRSVKPYACFTRNAKSISNLVPRKLDDRPTFGKDLVLGSEGKLAFSNGFWEFLSSEDETTGIKGRFVLGGDMETGVRISRSWSKPNNNDVDFVMEKLINPPFDGADPEIKLTFLRVLARALCGHKDKQLNVVIGGRDSSKSVLFQFLGNAIEGYFAMLPTEVFMAGGNGGGSDSFRANGWASNVEHARIATMVESGSDGAGRSIMNGNKIKNFQSLKEGLMSRRLYEEQRHVFSLATGFFLTNDIPDVKPADAMERFVIFPFNNKFVSAETKASHPFQSNYKLANPDVEAWIREPRYMDALLWIVFSHYQVEDVKIPEEMTEKKEMLMQDSGEDMLTDIFVFTADRNDRIKQKEALDRVRQKDSNANHARLEREIQTIMDTICGNKGMAKFKVVGNSTGGGGQKRQRVYIGIRFNDDSGMGNIGFDMGNQSSGQSSNGYTTDRGAYASGFIPPS
jgi:hypothetical protein